MPRDRELLSTTPKHNVITTSSHEVAAPFWIDSETFWCNRPTRSHHLSLSMGFQGYNSHFLAYIGRLRFTASDRQLVWEWKSPPYLPALVTGRRVEHANSMQDSLWLMSHPSASLTHSKKYKTPDVVCERRQCLNRLNFKKRVYYCNHNWYNYNGVSVKHPCFWYLCNFAAWLGFVHAIVTCSCMRYNILVRKKKKRKKKKKLFANIS